MKTKENWIEVTMKSLDGMDQAQRNSSLDKRIFNQFTDSPKKTLQYTPVYLLKIAAGLALLISINVFSVHYYSKNQKPDQTQTNPMATEYFSYIETIQL